MEIPVLPVSSLTSKLACKSFTVCGLLNPLCCNTNSQCNDVHHNVVCVKCFIKNKDTNFKEAFFYISKKKKKKKKESRNIMKNKKKKTNKINTRSEESDN